MVIPAGMGLYVHHIIAAVAQYRTDCGAMPFMRRSIERKHHLRPRGLRISDTILVPYPHHPRQQRLLDYPRLIRPGSRHMADPYVAHVDRKISRVVMRQQYLSLLATGNLCPGLKNFGIGIGAVTHIHVERIYVIGCHDLCHKRSPRTVRHDIPDHKTARHIAVRMDNPQ